MVTASYSGDEDAEGAEDAEDIECGEVGVFCGERREAYDASVVGLRACGDRRRHSVDLVALNAKTGRRYPDFGAGGEVDLRHIVVATGWTDRPGELVALALH